MNKNSKKIYFGKTTKSEDKEFYINIMYKGDKVMGRKLTKIWYAIKVHGKDQEFYIKHSKKEVAQKRLSEGWSTEEGEVIEVDYLGRPLKKVVEQV